MGQAVFYRSRLVRCPPEEGQPRQILVLPDGNSACATGTIAQSVSVSGAFGIAISPDGSTLFVTTNVGEIVVIDVASATVGKRRMTLGEPRQIIALPDNNTALAANTYGWIDLITR